VIFPAVVEKSDASIDGLVDDLPRDTFVIGIAQVVSATGKGRHFDAGAAEIAKRNAHNQMIRGYGESFGSHGY
jgi:hypothetical protein